MIVTRTPFRISFIGGGSDLPAFYNKSVGRVISAAINKYIFIAMNEKFDGKFRIGYSVTEITDHPHQIKNTRVRAALEYFKVKKALEIVSLADAPAHGTGLGSSSSFLVGLVTGLSQMFSEGIHKDRQSLAETACHLELNVLKEPIGKQDQYAAAYGGLNMIEFFPDKVVVHPIKISKEKKEEFKNHLMLFYTGIGRSATNNSKTLTNNLMTDDRKFDAQKKLSEAVIPFKEKLIKGDWQALGEILHDGWLLKKKTSNVISNKLVDEMYRLGMKNGAWGGKLLGAGGGGFVMFMVPPKNQLKVAKALNNFRHFPIGFDDHGSKVIFNRYEYS